MINRVLVAGRLTESPTLGVTVNGTPSACLELELLHPSWTGGEPDLCTVSVHAYGERISQVLDRYLTAGRAILVEGQLRQVDDGLCVVLDRFRFLMDKIEPRYFWDEARQAARRAAG